MAKIIHATASDVIEAVRANCTLIKANHLRSMKIMDSRGIVLDNFALARVLRECEFSQFLMRLQSVPLSSGATLHFSQRCSNVPFITVNVLPNDHIVTPMALVAAALNFEAQHQNGSVLVGRRRCGFDVDDYEVTKDAAPYDFIGLRDNMHSLPDFVSEYYVQIRSSASADRVPAVHYFVK